MKENIKFILQIVVVLLFIICIFASTKYICMHPEKRGISYYEDSNYYICRVDFSARGTPDHYRVINKSDYEKWKRGDNGTIWLVDSKRKDKGWRFNCRNILSIAIYDKNGWVPLLLN